MKIVALVPLSSFPLTVGQVAPAKLSRAHRDLLKRRVPVARNGDEEQRIKGEITKIHYTNVVIWRKMAPISS